MPSARTLSQLVTSYRFWDVVRLWARERLEHEDIVARALARAVVCDGLKLQSIDARWANPADQDLALRGRPYVGFCAKPEGSLCILRATALEHLLAIVHCADSPSPQKLSEEFIARADFLAWCEEADLARPRFWCSGDPRAI